MINPFGKRSLYLLVVLVVLFSCNKESEDVEIVEPEEMETNEMNPDVTTSTQPNILFIIADDMGKDATEGFSEGIIKPNTPNLNSIKDTGLIFNNFWTYPTCSPTRASIITGKYGYRTGGKFARDVLNNSEKILQQYINEETNNAYATAVVGKWHLAGRNAMTTPASLGMPVIKLLAFAVPILYYDKMICLLVKSIQRFLQI